MEAIGPLQLRVMHYIWENGPSTVHAVHDSLNAEPGAPKLAYTTILTVMRNLAKRKVLDQKPAGRSHMFEPLVDEQTYKMGILRSVRKDLFGGDLNRLLDLLKDDADIPADERAKLAAG